MYSNTRVSSRAASSTSSRLSSLQHKQVPLVISPHPELAVNVGDIQPPLWVEDGQQQLIVLLKQLPQLLWHLSQQQQVIHDNRRCSQPCVCGWSVSFSNKKAGVHGVHSLKIMQLLLSTPIATAQ